MWKNLTTAGRVLLSAIAAGVILGGAYVYKSGAAKVEQPAPVTVESASQTAEAQKPDQAKETAFQPPVAEVKPEAEPQREKRARSEPTERPEPAKQVSGGSSDPWADLKLDKKGQ